VLFLLLPAAVLLAGLIYQRIGAARDQRSYPMPGRLVDAGSAKLHLHVIGKGSPTVVFESGIGASSLSWAVVQPKAAGFTRTVTYDRAGLGWSALSRAPRTVTGMIGELRSVLMQASVAPPYLLVGHSFGGLLVRAHASQHPDEVAGLVLVDPVSVEGWANCPESELQRLKLGARLCTRGVWLARFGLVRLALATLIAGRNWFPRAAARMGGRRGTAALAHLVGEVRKLPPEYWPLVRAHWSEPKCFRALAGYLACLPENARDAAQMPVCPGTPMIIVSASNASPAELEERDRWIASNGMGRHIQVPDSGHWLHLERPEAVIAAISEVLAAARDRMVRAPD
jgi:pimeloyl-ACP methyl ester carboxylesterase